MGKDIIIKPSSSIIQFSGSTGEIGASIELDNVGRLVLSSSQVIFGPGNNDIYVGDGTSSANIIFDRDGAIKAESGSNAQITLGSGDSRLNISGSTVYITGSNVAIGPFSSSFANITSGSITASISSNFISASVVSASNARINNLVTTNYTSSYIALQPDGAIYFNDNTLAVAGLKAQNYVDTGSLIPFGDTAGDAFRIVSASTNWFFIASGYDATGSLPPSTGSVHYFGTGSVSASAFELLGNKINSVLSSSLLFYTINSTIFALSASFTGSRYNGIIFQSGSFSGSVSGSTGTSFNTIFTLAGGTNYTSSFLDRGGSISLDNLGNIVIDSVSGSVYLAKDRHDIYIGDGTSSANIVFDYNGAIKGEANARFNTGSFGLISGSRLNLNNNSGIFFTGSTSTPGASIQLDNFGDLVLSAVSGNVSIGNNTNEIYIGDGTGSASLLFDTGGNIKTTNGNALLIGSSSAPLYLTGSSVVLQQNGGTTVFGGSTVVTGSFTGSFIGNGSGLTNLNISSSNTSGSFTGSFGGTGSLRLETGSVGLSLDVASDFLRFSSGSTVNFAAQQVAGTTSMSFAFNTGSAVGGQGATFDVRATAVIMNPQGANYNENLRLPASPGGYSSIVMNGPVAGLASQGGVWSIYSYI